MGEVKGVILHSSLLFANDCDNNDTPTLRSGVDFLFRSLQFSQLQKGILIAEDLSIIKVNLLKTMSEEYSFDCFGFSVSAVDSVMDEIAVAWDDVGKKILFVVSSDNMDCWPTICDHGFLLSILDVDANGITNNQPSVDHIKKLEELPFRICLLNRKCKQVASNKVLTVGYSMKPSRQADFAKVSCKQGAIAFGFSLLVPSKISIVGGFGGMRRGGRSAETGNEVKAVG
ncbi:Inositol 1 3 4-trisphosphate 5/6-kinase 4 [Bienertia sinuspersici]